MTNDALHPYAIAVEPALRPEGQFVWAIRKHGKLIERSDRTYPSKAMAYAKALEAIEMDKNPEAGPRRR